MDGFTGSLRSDFVPLPSEAFKAANPGWGEKKRGTPFGRLTLYSMADLDAAPMRGYLIKGLIAPNEISVWCGPPKCGKSFLLMGCAWKLSRGDRVFGRRVHKVNVLYVAAEGEGGIGNRLKALRNKYGNAPGFFWIAQQVDLLHPDGDVEAIKKMAELCGPGLIIVDTINRSLAGGNENAPEDMGAFIARVTELREATNAHIACIHHPPHGSTRPRGHSSLVGAEDALIEVAKEQDGTRTATIIHAKDDADGARMAFTLEIVDLGTDSDNDPITTLVLNEMETPLPQKVQTEQLSKNEDLALGCLQKAINADAVLIHVGDPPVERAAVTVEQWRTWFYVEGKPGEAQETKRQAFKRAVEALQWKKRIGAENDYIWRLSRT
jgi:hypothetical protein